MKKIMFDEHYGLQTAAINGSKTMTRRIEKVPTEMITFPDAEFRFIAIANKTIEIGRYFEGRLIHKMRMYPRFMVGDTVAIAQSYKELVEKECLSPKREDAICEEILRGSEGVTNKMYVKADLMPHRIKITGIKIEKLQNISEEDCLREGIVQTPDGFTYPSCKETFATAREAFQSLIGKVCTDKTWEFNPWVTVYSFETV